LSFTFTTRWPLSLRALLMWLSFHTANLADLLERIKAEAQADAEAQILGHQALPSVAAHMVAGEHPSTMLML
jgi:hypothetical protein